MTTVFLDFFQVVKFNSFIQKTVYSQKKLMKDVLQLENVNSLLEKIQIQEQLNLLEQQHLNLD